ncbi:NOC2 [Mytilus edulis]|uniref:NOC2 n=1 Tax=Mytilus edulis TaxID=6550 RepID=A0A8S3U9X2_MYTED|nr:NOC2 [Mytilus edulis]
MGRRRSPFFWRFSKHLVQGCKDATAIKIEKKITLGKVFELTDFNKKHKSISFKPLNFACILKLSKAQLVEKSFKDGIIDQLYELFMDHFNIHAHKIGFPELVLPSILQMKEFLKKCKIANYCKQIKQIVDKVQETSKFITDRRKSVSFSISDDKAIVQELFFKMFKNRVLEVLEHKMAVLDVLEVLEQC